MVSWQKFAFFIINVIQGQFRSDTQKIIFLLVDRKPIRIYFLTFELFLISTAFVFSQSIVFFRAKIFELSKLKISKYFEYLEISDFDGNGSGSGSESDETQKLKKVSLHICNQ